MKRFSGYIIFLIMGMTVGTYLWLRQDTVTGTSLVSLTAIQTETDSVQLGTFPYAETKTTVFRFRNTGSHPLIIKNVHSSCGCADTRWNKKPIPPGQTDSLVVHFTPNSLGQFHKSIEMICNTTPQRHLFYLNGFVEE